MGYEGLEFKCYCRSKRYTEEFEGKQCEMCLSKITRRNNERIRTNQKGSIGL